MLKFLLIYFFILSSVVAEAQIFKLSGKVLDVNLQPIAYATVRLKNRETGTSTDAKGFYQLQVSNGNYEMVVSIIGYQTKTATVIINKADEKQNFILENSKSSIKEIKITSNRKDRSEEIIKNVIVRKEEILKRVKSYNVQLYIKALQETSANKNKIDANYFDLQKRVKDSIRKVIGSLNMAEVVLNLDYEYPNKIKETRLAVKKNDDISNLFYLTTTDGDFNLYNNLLKAPALSTASFLSPISNSGLIAYKFKTISITNYENYKQYRIKFTPRKSGNALIEGELIIMDSLWVLKSAVANFPNHLTPEYSKFAIKQQYEDVGEGIWLPILQTFDYMAANNKRNSGTSTVTYKSYNLDTLFPKKHFGEELSSTAQEAYEKDGKFWDENRTIPLTEKELIYVKFKDSVYQFTHSQTYYDSIDAVENKVTFRNIFFDGQSFYKRKNERRINLPPVPSMIRLFFLGGIRYGYSFAYTKRFDNYQRIRFRPEAFYGPNNNDLFGSLNTSFLYNPFTQGKVNFNFGKKFDVIFNNDALINYLSRSAYFKKISATLSHRVELINGLYLFNELEFANRSSLANYKLVNPELDSIFKSYGIPIFNNNTNRPIDFPAYNAFYNTITINYTHKQLYLREPRQKVVLGSKYPTIYFTWTKGINGLLGSSINFDYIETGAYKDINVGVLGNSKFKLMYGNFINRRLLNIVDYKWMRRGDPYVFFNPQNNFQALDSTFAIFKGFLKGHYYHEFNGFIINRIPYAKRLKIFESAGTGFLILPERNLRYGEIYYGLEKQFRLLGNEYKLGFFGVTNAANNKVNPFQWKFGIRTYDAYYNTWQ
jgi:hypothetical protein